MASSLVLLVACCLVLAVAAAHAQGTTKITATVTKNLYTPRSSTAKQHRRFNLIVYELPVDPTKVNVANLLVGALAVNDAPMESPGTGIEVVVPNTFACSVTSDLAVGTGDSFGPESPCNYGEKLEIQPDLTLRPVGDALTSQIVIVNPAKESASHSFYCAHTATLP